MKVLLQSIFPILLALVLPVRAIAATYNVSSIAELNTRIASAVAGDVIIVQNGVYTTTSSIGVSRVGTAANPILIRAETVGGVEITGSHGFSLNSGAAHVIIQGFVFTHTSGRNAVNNGATFCRFTRNIFQCTGEGNYLVISGHDTRIDRNEFRNKSTVGNMIDVRGSGSQIARRVWIHHNYFHDFTNAGGNGAETIRFGLSGLSLSTGDGLIEYNLFVRCNGENELISNKSSGNVYRYNTLINSPGAQLTLRHGNECLAYGNYFRNTDGLRVYGDRHQIFANYFHGNTKGIDMGNGGGEVADGDPLTSHDRPDNCVVSFNTFITNNVHYQMGGRTDGLGASNIVVANNIFQGPGNMASISGTAPYIGTWSGNIRWNNNNAGSMPPSGYTTANPLLVADANGIYHIQAGSPAIGAAVGSYPAVTVDMDGQPRDAAKDVGADEFSNAPIIARILTTNDVGPNSIENGFQFDFVATPSTRTVLPGQSVAFTATVTPLNGTTGVVSLAVSGLPTGVGATFNPPIITNSGSSTVTIIASNNAVFGNYSLNVSGTALGGMKSSQVSLVVGDFLVNVNPASQTILHGNSAVYTVTVTTNSLFAGTVTFGISGLPAFANAAFNPPTLNGAGNSTLTITTEDDVAPGTYNLTIAGTGGTSGSGASKVVSLAITGDVAAPGTLFWTGTNNWSQPLHWTNVTAGGFGSPGPANDLVFTNIATIASSNAVNSIVDDDTTINSLVFANTSGFHNLMIAAGRTLTITGAAPGYQSTAAINVGQDFNPGTIERVRASLSGPDATVIISNVAATVQVRQGFGSGNVGSLATLDMSGLGTFDATLRRFQLGSESSNPRRVAGIWYLARTNTITLVQALDVNSTNLTSGTPALILGHNTQAANTNGSVLYLGVTNAIFVNHVVIGRGNQTNNLVAFNPAFLPENPSAFFRGSDGESRVGQWVVGDNSAGSLTIPGSGTNDFTGGTVDAMVDRLFLGRGRNGNTVNTGFGTLTFDAGIIDVNTMRLGTMVDEVSSTNASGVGVANVNGTGTLIVNGVLEFAHTNVIAPAAASAVAAMRGTLNVNGGTVQATNVIGAGGTGIINLNSGMIDLDPDWAVAPGILSGITTLNIGAPGSAGSAVLANARIVSVVNAITIASNGVLRGNSTINSPGLAVNGTIAPGSSVGRITNNAAATFGPGGKYVVEVNNAAGTPGSGWDYFRTAGSLTIAASPANPFVLQLVSLEDDDAGDADNFNSDASYDWEIGSAGGGLTGFDTEKFSINDALFGNDLQGGYFMIRANGGALVLSFTNNHPPHAISTAYYRSGDTLMIPIAELASSWSDPDGDPVEFAGVIPTGTNGLSSVGTDGTFLYYTNAGAEADEIQYTIVDIRTNSPALYRNGDTQRSAVGTIRIVPAPMLSGTVSGGGNLIFGVSGGIGGGTYQLLSSTNLSTPLGNWNVAGSGTFDSFGAFLFTNAIGTAPQMFYRLKVP